MIKQEYQDISAFLKNGHFPSNFASTKGNFARKAKKYTLNASGRLMRNSLPVVLHSERKRIFDEFQQRNSLYFYCKIPQCLFLGRKYIVDFFDQHRCRDKCVILVRERYFWPGGYKYIAEQTRKCVACSYKKCKRYILFAKKIISELAIEHATTKAN